MALTKAEIQELCRVKAELREKRETCRHEGWNWKQHGRVCFDCGTVIVDFGD